eukprot:TRINITY_DN5547_c0_g1_i1.p1 TRINITY_DN5547_c0_g1~~TRINITY_DN5547_c0_g1_i1.p1  ORF type:complete len:579 (-),score=73.90 TRINITY_DN5547_c0_g1_i1:189-1925(-)
MIEYDFGKWGVGFILQLKGSVFPKAMAFALPNAVLTFILNILYHRSGDDVEDVLGQPGESWSGAMSIWSSYTGSLAFLLIFRTQIAYSRFWEGGTTLQQVRGVWFNATSNLIAFCNDDPKFVDKVTTFQHMLVRLMSMLYCMSVQQVAVLDDEDFEIMELDGFDLDSLDFLHDSKEKCEVVMQWVQRSIVLNIHSEVIKIAPPIISRVFQELSNGVVDVMNAKKITEVQFPFPYAQMITVMLLMHWTLTPVVGAVIIGPQQRYIGSIIVFITLFSLWCLNYTAAELEMPFGDDPNDLPVADMVHSFNSSLKNLLEPMVQNPPSFVYSAGSKRVGFSKSSTFGGLLTASSRSDDPTRNDSSASCVSTKIAHCGIEETCSAASDDRALSDVVECVAEPIMSTENLEKAFERQRSPVPENRNLQKAFDRQRSPESMKAFDRQRSPHVPPETPVRGFFGPPSSDSRSYGAEHEPGGLRTKPLDIEAIGFTDTRDDCRNGFQEVSENNTDCATLPASSSVRTLSSNSSVPKDDQPNRDTGGPAQATLAARSLGSLETHKHSEQFCADCPVSSTMQPRYHSTDI